MAFDGWPVISMLYDACAEAEDQSHKHCQHDEHNRARRKLGRLLDRGSTTQAATSADGAGERQPKQAEIVKDATRTAAATAVAKALLYICLLVSTIMGLMAITGLLPIMIQLPPTADRLLAHHER